MDTPSRVLAGGQEITEHARNHSVSQARTTKTQIDGSISYRDLVVIDTPIKRDEVISLRQSIGHKLHFNRHSMMAESSNNLQIPTHLRDTLRYRQYRWNKKADLAVRAMEVVSKKRDEVAFLGIPLEESLS
ncbi:MAG: hypothetical protein VXZ59_02605 [Cyanobacteriota bacterium]|nr:hypothetical protein [Cyanobacteriota bacterium]